MNFFYLLRSIVLSFPLVSAPIVLAQTVDREVAMTFKEVAQRSQQFTVLIKSSNGSQGSGVIFKHEGNKYTILTAAHVLCGNNYYSTCDRQLRYNILIKDRQYSANFTNVKLVPDRVDLATVNFSSDRHYPSAKIGDSSKLAIGVPAYVAGFPAPTLAIEKSLFITYEGKIVAVAGGNRRINKKGYGLIYNTPTLPGMSGGGVFNDRGELIAIHGQGDRDIETGDKTGNNLGIPINSFVRQSTSTNEVNPNSTDRLLANPLTADDFLITGVSKYNDGNKQGSIADFNRAARLNPNSAIAFYNRGYIRSNLGNKQSALADLSQAIALDPNYLKAYYSRGLIRADIGDRRGALSDFNQAIAIAPNYRKAYIQRAAIRDELGDFTDAIADYTKAIDLDSKQAKIYYQRGLARYNSGDKQAAIVDYDRAIQLNSKYALVYYRRGIAHYDLQDRQGAASDLQNAARLFKLFDNQTLYEEVISLLDRIK